MRDNVAPIATFVKPGLAMELNDWLAAGFYKLHMAQVTKIHQSKRPWRIHYLAEWAERRDKIQADFVEATGADKGTVSRWFAGGLPETPYLLKITGFLELDEPNDLFRHPDDNWFKRMFENRSKKEIEDSKRLVAIHLGKSGTDG